MRPKALAALVLLAPLLAGCLVEARLRADGGGTLRLRYRLDEHATLEAVAARLASPSVIVRSARIDRERIGTFKIEFQDANALSSTQMLRNVSVTNAPGAEPGTTAWTAKLVQPKPIKLNEKVLEQYGKDMTIRITFPGPIVATNATSRDGTTATWVIPLETITSAPETLFTATYTTARAPGGQG